MAITVYHIKILQGQKDEDGFAIPSALSSMPLPKPASTNGNAPKTSSAPPPGYRGPPPGYVAREDAPPAKKAKRKLISSLKRLEN